MRLFRLSAGRYNGIRKIKKSGNAGIQLSYTTGFLSTQHFTTYILQATIKFNLLYFVKSS